MLTNEKIEAIKLKLAKIEQELNILNSNLPESMHSTILKIKLTHFLDFYYYYLGHLVDQN